MRIKDISKSKIAKQLFITAILTLVVIAGRLVPHLPNFTPLIAVALFGGVYLDKKYAVILPLVALFISDIFIGFHDTMVHVYASTLLVAVLGAFARNNKSIKTVTLGALSGSLLFFLITNFGVWAQGSLYPQTISGLLESYYMGIPFFRNSLLGNAFYVIVLFGGYELVLKQAGARNLVKKTFNI